MAFWWMFPVMMLFMVLICAVVVYFLFSRLSGGAHQSGAMDRQWDMGYSTLGFWTGAMPEARFRRKSIRKGRPRFSPVGCVDRNRETILGVRQFSDAKFGAFSNDLSGTPPIILQGVSGAPGYARPLGS
jgi:hypothetical protein